MSELLGRPECLQDVHKILPSLVDSDRLLKHFMQKPSYTGQSRAKAAISAVLGLKASLAAAPLLAAALTSSGEAPPENELLCAIVGNLGSPDLEAMRAMIDELIEEDTAYDKRASQRALACLFAVKKGASRVLDVLRQTLMETTQDMDRLVCHYRDELQLDDLKLLYSERRGYHITLPVAHKEVAERNGFIQLQSQAKRTLACSTEQLAQLNSRAKETICQILATTEAELEKLEDAIRANLHLLFIMGESVALLDMMQSFTTFVGAAGGPYTSPTTY